MNNKRHIFLILILWSFIVLSCRKDTSLCDAGEYYAMVGNTIYSFNEDGQILFVTSDCSKGKLGHHYKKYTYYEDGMLKSTRSIYAGGYGWSESEIECDGSGNCVKRLEVEGWTEIAYHNFTIDQDGNTLTYSYDDDTDYYYYSTPSVLDSIIRSDYSERNYFDYDNEHLIKVTLLVDWNSLGDTLKEVTFSYNEDGQLMEVIDLRYPTNSWPTTSKWVRTFDYSKKGKLVRASHTYNDSESSQYIIRNQNNVSFINMNPLNFYRYRYLPLNYFGSYQFNP